MNLLVTAIQRSFLTYLVKIMIFPYNNKFKETHNYSGQPD